MRYRGNVVKVWSKSYSSKIPHGSWGPGWNYCFFFRRSSGKASICGQISAQLGQCAPATMGPHTPQKLAIYNNSVMEEVEQWGEQGCGGGRLAKGRLRRRKQGVGRFCGRGAQPRAGGVRSRRIDRRRPLCCPIPKPVPRRGLCLRGGDHVKFRAQQTGMRG